MILGWNIHFLLLLLTVSQICFGHTSSSLSIPDSENRGKDYSKEQLYFPDTVTCSGMEARLSFPRWDSVTSRSNKELLDKTVCWNHRSQACYCGHKEVCQWDSPEEKDDEMVVNGTVWISKQGTNKLQSNKCHNKYHICVFVA